MTEITVNIRKFRKKAGMSQNDLAEQLNVTRQTVSSWENGKTYPDLDMVVKLSEVLGTDPNHLLYPERSQKKRVEIPHISPAWVLMTMIVMFIGLTYGDIIWRPLLGWIIEWNVYTSYLFPIYGGLILLAGLVALCAILILDAIEDMRYHRSDDE